MLVIIRYNSFSCPQSVLKDLESLDEYCQLRNGLVHQFEGVSKSDLTEEDANNLVKNIQNIIEYLFNENQEVFRKENSFAVLNREIIDRFTSIPPEC